MGATAAFLLTVFQVVCSPQGCQGSQVQLMLPVSEEKECVQEGLGMVARFIKQNYGKPAYTYTFTCKKVEAPGAPSSPAIDPDKKDDTI